MATNDDDRRSKRHSATSNDGPPLTLAIDNHIEDAVLYTTTNGQVAAKGREDTALSVDGKPDANNAATADKIENKSVAFRSFLGNHQQQNGVDGARHAADLPLIDMDRDIDFDDVLRLIHPFGLWQKILIFTAPVLGSWPFVLMPAFVAIKVPHYCRVPALENNNSTTTWTAAEIRNLSIPAKAVNAPPAIGQAYEPCKYYNLPYEQMALLPFEEAYARRTEFAGNASSIPQRECDSGWHYDVDAVQFKSSVQIDFDVVCKREHLLQLNLSLYMIGMLIGVITFGAISDRFGRRNAALLSGFLLIPVALAIPLSPSFLIFCILRFAMALLLNGHFISMYVLTMEIIGPDYRAGVGFWQNVPFYIGYTLLAPMAYLLNDSWRWLYATQNWPLLMMFVYYFLVPESPRWLITQGRYQEARKILEHAARVNGRWPLPVPISTELLRKCRGHLAQASLRRSISGRSTQLAQSDAQQEVVVENDDSSQHRPLKPETSALHRATKYGIMSATACASLLKTPELRQRTVLSCFLWFSVCMVYYGMAFYAVKLEGDIFVNFSLMGAVALPAYALSWFAYQRFGRKPPLVAVLVLCGIFCCAIAAIDWMGKFQQWHLLVLVCATAGKFFMTGAFGMIYVYSAEIFPTVVRNVGISSNSMIARLGSASAPYVNEISDFLWHPLPMLIYGLLSIFTALTTTLLPETHNVDLVESIEDIELERRAQYRASLKSKSMSRESSMRQV